MTLRTPWNCKTDIRMDLENMASTSEKYVDPADGTPFYLIQIVFIAILFIVAVNPHR